MKKFLILFISVICFCSCTFNGSFPKSNSTEQIGVSLVELCINNDTCEYIVYEPTVYRGCMSHWTKCKYCAARNNVKQNELKVLTKDCVEVTIYYTGNEIYIEKLNDIRSYFHDYLISEVNTEEFEDNFYQTFRLENCKFDYNIK